ncbi:DUF6931 family protein [Bosea sp. PAMC 26642]|uniref:DUF6931 family protein n=1 Tax=Bosea sp. (strain PAMC 26642) TaxID=1792307 RepID=UPI000770409E|nr:hypothetical protein [Bosea sp. PAMC 26642]AMJ62810.1 hypothetical protein AXW83_23205 [Bosea sp. PAMC 26642]
MSRLRFNTALEVFETFPAARKLIKAAPTTEHPILFLRRLVQMGPARDALGFCAFLLPRRETVWWAIQALKLMQTPGVAGDPCVAAAETWVRNPDDSRRRAALDAAEAADNEAPGTWLAWAAGYSGGSMVATHFVPCPPDLTAKSARIAVMLAFGLLPASGRDTALRACVEACIRLADDDDGRARS